MILDRGRTRAGTPHRDAAQRRRAAAAAPIATPRSTTPPAHRQRRRRQRPDATARRDVPERRDGHGCGDYDRGSARPRRSGGDRRRDARRAAAAMRQRRDAAAVDAGADARRRRRRPTRPTAAADARPTRGGDDDRSTLADARDSAIAGERPAKPVPPSVRAAHRRSMSAKWTAPPLRMEEAARTRRALAARRCHRSRPAAGRAGAAGGARISAMRLPRTARHASAARSGVRRARLRHRSAARHARAVDRRLGPAGRSRAPRAAAP